MPVAEMLRSARRSSLTAQRLPSGVPVGLSPPSAVLRYHLSAIRWRAKVVSVKSYALYRECAGQVDVEYEKCLIAGAFPIQPLGLSRPTLAGRLLYGDCIALSFWAVPVGMAQRASPTHRHAIAESVAAQSS